MRAMEKNDQLLYLSCQLQGHHKQPLSRVCLHENCPHNQLCCDQCAVTYHHGHQTAMLSDFIDKVDALRDDNAVSNSTHAAIAQFKKTKIKALSEVAATKKHISELLGLLNGVENYYLALERQLQACSRVSTVDFTYRPAQGLAEINRQLGWALHSYHQGKQDQGVYWKIQRDAASKTAEVVSRLRDLVKTAETEIRGVLNIFTSSLGEQHPSLSVLGAKEPTRSPQKMGKQSGISIDASVMNEYNKRRIKDHAQLIKVQPILRKH